MNHESISTVSVLPISYKLDIDITKLVDGETSNAENTEIIDGHLIYTFLVRAATLVVQLNAKEMTISNTKLLTKDEIVATEEGGGITTTYNEDTNTYSFVFASVLPEEELKLELDFVYSLSKKLVGHYGCPYLNANGQIKRMVSFIFHIITVLLLIIYLEQYKIRAPSLQTSISLCRSTRF